MVTPFHSSLVGSSALFEHFIFNKLSKEDKVIRYGINSELAKSIDIELIQNFIPIRNKKGQPCKINKIAARGTKTSYSAIVNKFPGAWVKEPDAKIINNGSIVIDLDASLPPYEKIYIRRNNIIQHICIGDYIFHENDETLTWDKNNKTCWKKVLGKTEHDWNDIIVKIITETGKEVVVTGNHSVFGIMKHWYHCDTPQLIDANELEVGDYVVGYKQFETDGILQSYNPELLGFWLSDGWSSNGTSFYIAKQDKELLEIFSPYIDNIRIKRHQSLKYKEEWVGTIVEPIKSEIKPFYNSSKSKNFNHILNYTLNNRKRIWDGMFFADGYFHGLGKVNNPTPRLCKYRKEEKDECFNIAHTIGWFPHNVKDGINNRVTRIDKSLRYGPHQVCPQIYRSHIGYGTILHKNNMGANCRHGLNKIGPLLPYVYNSYSDFIGLEKINNIVKENYIGKVYDISVEETERFFAGSGIGVHNTALYPSMILQSNISFDSYEGRVIPPVCYTTLKLLEKHLGKSPLPMNQLATTLSQMVVNYVNKEDEASKEELSTNIYYTLMYLFNNLEKLNIPYDRLIKPTTSIESVAFKTLLVPLLDIMNNIHPQAQKFNQYAYDHVYMDYDKLKQVYPEIYILHNPNESDSYIELYTLDAARNYIKTKIITFAGTLFVKHDEKLGLFAEFLQRMKNMRNSYKRKLKDYAIGSIEHSYNDSRQKTVKIVMNTTLI